MDYGKLILYSTAILLALLVCLVVWWRTRHVRRPIVRVQNGITLLGWKRDDGAMEVTRAVRTEQGVSTSVEFTSPLLLKQGETTDLYFAIPAGCAPVGTEWHTFPIEEKQ